MKSFLETLRDPLTGVVACPPNGKLPRKFRPVSVEPWAPEPRRVRGRRKRPVTVEQVEKINAALQGPPTPTAQPSDRPADPITYMSIQYDGDGKFGEIEDAGEEFTDSNYFDTVEANGIRSLVQPSISSTDWSWRAPAARCRSCGAVIWIASIADGIRMLRGARHRKSCTCPPSRLEIELSCSGT